MTAVPSPGGQTASVPVEGSHLPTDAHAHPGPFEYIKVAVVLAVVTAAEVTVYYMSGLKSLMVPVLVGMSVVKFGLVGLYFMHLKFDTRLFRRLFALGIVLAILVYSVVLATLLR
jgi:cytochrome c oxidase subunit 4